MKSADNSMYTKKQLLSWINDILKIEVQAIEELSNGAVFCQLLDMINPGVVRMQKVNWSAKLQHQSLANLKIVSSSMLALNIDKKFQVTRVAQKKTQDILELLQWFRKYFFVNHISMTNYDPVSRRKPMQSEKNSCQQRKSSQIILKSRQQLQFKPQFCVKKQCQDIIKDSELKSIIKKNKQIQKIVLQQVTGCAQQKLKLIKKILLQKNQSANQNKNSNQLSTSSVRSENTLQKSNMKKEEDKIKIQYLHAQDRPINYIFLNESSSKLQNKSFLENELLSSANFRSQKKRKQEV